MTGGGQQVPVGIELVLPGNVRRPQREALIELISPEDLGQRGLRLPDAERTQTAPEWLAVRDVPAGPASP